MRRSPEVKLIPHDQPRTTISINVYSNALAFVKRRLIGKRKKICDSISCDILSEIA